MGTEHHLNIIYSTTVKFSENINVVDLILDNDDFFTVVRHTTVKRSS